MKRTAYDILGVSPGASSDEIAAAFARQRAKLDPALPENAGNPDSEFQSKILREAFSLVDEPARRSAYDASLRAPVPYYPDAAPRSVEISRKKMVLAGVMFLATVGAGLSYLYQNKKQELALERERILAAEKEAARRAEEFEQAAQYGNAGDESWQQRQQERRIQAEMEAARAEGREVSERLQYEEEAARRRAEWEHQREEQEARAEQWRAEREAAARRYQPQREYRPRPTSPGGSVAVVPHPGRPVTGEERQAPSAENDKR